MKIISLLPIVLAFALAVPGSALAELNVGEPVTNCAGKSVAKKVAAFYAERPGAPSPIPARALGIPELHVVTALPGENRTGVKATEQLLEDLWVTIDAWGEDTRVNLVFTMGGQHVLDFPSLVPIRQEDLDDGWIDAYADRGDGVHGHLWMDRVTSVHAIDIEGTDDTRTRGVLFFAPEGDLAMGVYASVAGKAFDQNAVDGFGGTWDFLASGEQVCN